MGRRGAVGSDSGGKLTGLEVCVSSQKRTGVSIFIGKEGGGESEGIFRGGNFSKG